MTRKPEGIAEATQLLRKLARVPKAELDRQIAKPKKRATKRKKKS
jgi:hypothetical protein